MTLALARAACLVYIAGGVLHDKTAALESIHRTLEGSGGRRCGGAGALSPDAAGGADRRRSLRGLGGGGGSVRSRAGLSAARETDRAHCRDRTIAGPGLDQGEPGRFGACARRPLLHL